MGNTDLCTLNLSPTSPGKRAWCIPAPSVSIPKQPIHSLGHSWCPLSLHLTGTVVGPGFTYRLALTLQTWILAFLVFLVLDLNCLHVGFLLFNLCSVLAYQTDYEDFPGEQMSTDCSCPGEGCPLRGETRAALCWTPSTAAVSRRPRAGHGCALETRWWWLKKMYLREGKGHHWHRGEGMKPVRNSSGNVKVREGGWAAGAPGSTADNPIAALGQGYSRQDGLSLKELQSLRRSCWRRGKVWKEEGADRAATIACWPQSLLPLILLALLGQTQEWKSALEPGRSRRRDINVCLHFSLSASGWIEYKLMLICLTSTQFHSL